MEIRADAAKRIVELKTRQRVPPETGVRISLGEKGVCLAWAPDGPGETDMVVKTQGVSLFIEARAYVRLADCELDVQGRRFVFRQQLLVAPHQRRK